VEDPSPEAVDVVIVNYRSYDELGRCLASLEQSRSHFGQVIIIDHESDLDEASRISQRFPWVRVVECPTNEGFAAGVNVGARQTGSPFILLLNPDCVAHPDAVSQLVRFARTRPDAAAIGPRILNSDGTVQGSARRFPGITTAIAGRSSWLTRKFPNNPLSRHNLPSLDERSAPLNVDWVSGACMLIRRTAFDQVNGMDEGFFLYWEDADLCRRLTENGWRIVYFPGATVVHAGGRSSIHVYRESLVAFHQSAFFLFRKHARWPVRVFQPLVYIGLRMRLRVLLFLHRHRLRNATAAAAEGSMDQRSSRQMEGQER
jgi:GT2 family glycosyltransferase